MTSKLYRRIFLLSLLLPVISLLNYWGSVSLPNGPLTYILSFLVILPNFTGLLIVNSLIPIAIENPADPFHIIAGITVNWVVFAGTITLIWILASLRRK
jgi:hypothetical protein